MGLELPWHLRLMFSSYLQFTMLAFFVSLGKGQGLHIQDSRSLHEVWRDCACAELSLQGFDFKAGKAESQ